MQQTPITEDSTQVQVFFEQTLNMLLSKGLAFSYNPELIWVRTGEGSFSGEWQERFTSNVGYIFHRVETELKTLFDASPSVNRWVEDVGAYFPNHRYVSNQQALPIPVVLGIDRILRILGYLLPSLAPEGAIPFTTSIGLALSQLDAYLYSENRLYQSWIVVLAHTRVTEPIQVDPSTRLRVLSDSEAHHAASGPALFRVLGTESPLVYQSMTLSNWFNAQEDRSIIEIRERRDGKGDETIGAATFRSRDLVSALRLLKGGSTRSVQYWLQDSNPWAPWPYSIQRFGSDGAQGWLRDATEVTPTDAQDIGSMCAALQALPAESLCRRVLSRVEDSFGRDREEDRLLDCWMGLEMMFTRKREYLNPLGIYRCSWYLGDNYQERSEIIGELHLANVRRNSLVHRNHQLDYTKTKESAEATERLLISSLCKAILSGIEPDLDDLDTKLLGQP